MFRLYTGGADKQAALCDCSEMHFHISLLLALPVSLALSSRLSLFTLSMSVSSLFSFSHHLFSPPLSPGPFSLSVSSSSHTDHPLFQSAL